MSGSRPVSADRPPTKSWPPTRQEWAPELSRFRLPLAHATLAHAPRTYTLPLRRTTIQATCLRSPADRASAGDGRARMAALERRRWSDDRSPPRGRVREINDHQVPEARDGAGRRGRADTARRARVGLATRAITPALAHVR